MSDNGSGAVRHGAGRPARERSFWARLGPAERAAVRAVATRRPYRPKDVLCRQGEESWHVVVLLKGNMRISAFGADGREITIAVRGPGDVIGEMAAVEAGPRTATVTALDEVDALTIPGPRFAALCQAHGRIAWALLGVLTGRLRDSGRQWVEFEGASAEQRIVALLLDLAARIGTRTREGVEIRTSSSQEELAATVGSSRESMARVLRALRTRGIVSTARGRIVIHRPAELRAMAP